MPGRLARPSVAASVGGTLDVGMPILCRSRRGHITRRGVGPTISLVGRTPARIYGRLVGVTRRKGGPRVSRVVGRIACPVASLPRPFPGGRRRLVAHLLGRRVDEGAAPPSRVTPFVGTGTCETGGNVAGLSRTAMAALGAVSSGARTPIVSL